MSRLPACFPQLSPVESLIANDAATPDPIVFRISFDKVTGPREGN